MSHLLLIASFNAFFCLALLLQKRPKLIPDRILVFWLAYLGLATGSYGLSVEYFSESNWLSNASIGFFLLQGPFLYLYVSALSLNKKRFKPKQLFHFLPFLGFILYLLIAFQFPNYSERIRIDHLSLNTVESPFLFVFFLILNAVSGPIYFLMTFKKFKAVKKEALDHSSTEINLKWLGLLIAIFGIVWTALVVIAVIHHIFHLFSTDFCINGLFLSLSAFTVLIGYFGLRQKEVFFSYSQEVEIEPKEEPQIKYAATKMEGEELLRCCNKVGQFMLMNKPYLDPDLTLPKLAKDLNVSTHHLSQVINEMHGKNFFNFINKYRVEEVKRKIADPKYKNLSLLGIAYESGFNSKSAFNRVFKNITGTTPSAYRDSLSA